MADAGDVITWLDGHKGGNDTWTETELAEATGAPLSSVRYAMRQLDERGWADQADGKWRWA